MVRLALFGDVMTGRGIDQILPHPSRPELYEPYIRDARDYVALAEEVNGPVEKPVGHAYIWGDVLDDLDRASPDARIINLETSITRSDTPWRGKSIHYRMHPANVPCLTAARVDCCSLANNHVLDWGYDGLIETLETLTSAGVAATGAGRNLREAEAPAILDVPGRGRVLVFACGTETSGIPPSWAASEDAPGVSLLPDLSPASADCVRERVGRARKEKHDLVVFSIHWGGNWGYPISARESDFAHRLVEDGTVDVLHGHSSHHVKALDVHGGRPILYGCGDFLDDYEGISGHESYRDELGMIYLPELDAAGGALSTMELIPTRIQRLRVNRAHGEDVQWLHHVLNREGRRFGTRAPLNDDETLSLEWNSE